MRTIHKLLMATVMLLAICTVSSAQEARPFKVHEISVGVAPIPLLGGFTPRCPNEIEGENERVGDFHSIPLCTISYNHFYNKWFSINIRGSLSGYYYYVYPDNKPNTSRFEGDPCVSVIGMAQFTFLNRDAVRLYSSIGLGVCAWGGVLLPTAQTTAFGVSFGKRFFGFLEIGSGSEYLGCYGGIGYRF